MDENGIFQGRQKDPDDPSWGYCGPLCATHQETQIWAADETFKMSLQYDHHVLLLGLELFGILLAGILISGLIIVLVPAIGK